MYIKLCLTKKHIQNGQQTWPKALNKLKSICEK